MTLSKFRFRFNTPNVFSAIFPVYLLTHFIGLSNYKVVEIDGAKRYKSTILMTIKSLVQILFLIGIVTYDLTFSEELGDNSMGDTISYYQSITACGLSIANAVFGLLYSTKICKIINEINNVKKEFEKLGVEVDYRNTFKRCFLSVTTIILLLFVYVGYMNYLSWDVFTYTNILHDFANFYPYLLNLIVEVQYANYGIIIKDGFRTTNKYLEALFENAYGAWFIDEKKSSKKPQRPLKPDSDPSSWIDTVAGFHIKLADLATLLNQAFRVQLLFLIATAFIGIVTALFLIAISFKDTQTDDESESWNFMFTCWAFTNALGLLVIIHTTARLCDEANRCPKILHKIRNKTADSKLHETIEIYSLQMYHNRLQFYVCGLFPLDYTLLYTIVASVTTHLVILIQFNSAQYHGGKLTSTFNITQLLNNTM